MKHLYFLLGITFIGAAANAQVPDRSLIGTAGTVFSTPTLQISFSIGEAVVMPTPAIHNNGATASFATTGFQQTHIAKKGATIEPIDWVSAYPNPTTGIVKIDAHGSGNRNYAVIVTNILGETVFTPINFNNGKTEVDLTNLPAGAYIIKMYQAEMRRTMATRVIKVN